VAIPSKLEFAMRPGDQLDVWTSGGGGYGDPLERAPEAVLADVLDGKVSRVAAQSTYGVVIAGRSVDERATEALRARLAAERGRVTWRYDRGPLGRE
jgi:N-methylhydantoinase B